MMLPTVGLKGLVPISMAFGTGGIVLIRQAVGQNTQYFGELGGWVIGVLILAIGALIAYGIRDFQTSQRQTDAKVDKMEDRFFRRLNELQNQIYELRGDLREQRGRDSST